MPDYTVVIRDLPEEERPRERLAKHGPGGLSTAELIAILLRVGARGQSAIGLAQRLLAEFEGIEGVARASVERLSKVKGVGLAKAAQLKAAFELGKRLATEPQDQRPTIRGPQDAARIPHTGLAEIVARATRENPDERYPTMAAVVSAIEVAFPQAARRPEEIPLPPPEPLPPACLRRLDGPAETHPVGERTVLGRGGKATVRIRHPTLSRVHAKLVRRRSGEAYVFDLSSLNGTRVDSRPVSAGPIRPGSVLGIGDVRFRFDEGPQALVPAAPAPPPAPATGAGTEAPPRELTLDGGSTVGRAGTVVPPASKVWPPPGDTDATPATGVPPVGTP